MALSKAVATLGSTEKIISGRIPCLRSTEILCLLCTLKFRTTQRVHLRGWGMTKPSVALTSFKNIFNRDYFENGLEKGVSCYQNYRWIPELTIPMAMTIIDYLGINRHAKVLDFGCAKGYLVKAFRLLYRRAWGVDISNYAISQCDPDVRGYCVLECNRKAIPKTYDFCIVKDVFEHIPEHLLPLVLEEICAEKIFAIVPLGNKDGYRAPINDHDVTHVVCKNEKWWQELFNKCGLFIEDFQFKVDGIKDSYYEKYPEAHGFFTLTRPSP
jgi:SAM-dependent methyltransferase